MKVKILRCALEKLTVCHYEGKLIKGGKFTFFPPVVQEDNLFLKVNYLDSKGKKKKIYEKISQNF